MENKYIVSSTPHIRSTDSVQQIMRDVVIALLPASLAGVYFFGIRALCIIILTVGSCVFFEAMYQKITKQAITIDDYSAVVTGLLLAMNLPPTVPFWIPIVGSFFAIVFVKQLYGGLGQNFMNPALGARAFLFVSFAKAMATWAEPNAQLLKFSTDVMTGATPLSDIKMYGFVPGTQDIWNAFIGQIGGCIGETSALLLLVGGIYLIVKKVISWHIPVSYIGTVFLLSALMGRNAVYDIFIGGLFLGAFFMATDYTSSPVTPLGQWIMGIGCGFLTALLRQFGSYPEIVSFAILIMNLFVPLIDRYTKPVVFGTKRRV